MLVRGVLLSLSLLAVACGGVEPGEWDAEVLKARSDTLTITTEDQVVARLPSSSGANYGYVEYLPPGYLTSTLSYPVVIHLNGAGEFGTSTTEADLLSVVTRNGALKLIRNTAQGKAYFGGQKVMVFAPRAATSWVPAELNTFVNFLIANYRVDATRIYLTGLSAGGYGSWTYANAYGNRLAALAPMATNIGGPGPTLTQLLNVPIWATHSFSDGTSLSAEQSWLLGVTKNYGYSQLLSVAQPSATVTYLFNAATKVWTSQAGFVSSGSSIARLTVYPGSAHDCWTASYNNYAFWDWLLSQQRGSVP